MKTGDFARMQEELRDHQMTAAAAFCASHGLKFDAEALERQALITMGERAMEILFFAAQVFPDEDEISPTP